MLVESFFVIGLLKKKMTIDQYISLNLIFCLKKSL